MANRGRRPYRMQPRVQGGREALPSCVLHEIWEEVDALAVKHGVSRSWVIATVLADAFGIKGQPSYEAPRNQRKAG